jgi:hypothetical protein
MVRRNATKSTLQVGGGMTNVMATAIPNNLQLLNKL